MSTAASTPCAQSCDSSSANEVRRSRSISSSAEARAIALSTSRLEMISATRATICSATWAIRSMVGRAWSGTAMPGTRSRAILATCTERSPIRSSSLTIRSAATMVRRSRATGCCSERSSKADSSTRSRARSISRSALITRSAMAASPVMRAVGGEADGAVDVAADAGEVGEDLLELVVELVAHVADSTDRR